VGPVSSLGTIWAFLGLERLINQINKQTDRLQSSGNLPLPEILDALGTNQSRKRLKTPSPCFRLVEYSRGFSIFKLLHMRDHLPAYIKYTRLHRKEVSTVSKT
jgi:hypothetical protein